MGDYLSRITTSLFDYPLKTTHPCVYSSEVPQEDNTDTPIESNYDKLVNKFTKKLQKNRMENRTGDYKSWEEKYLLINFPEWNESTISYLHSLFLTFSNENKMIDFKAFLCILSCLWCEIDNEEKRNQFKTTDVNQDGFIEYLEFLNLIYSDENLTTVTKSIAEQTQFVNALSIGEQLECGLF
ncbi:uncharacterized protein LOC130450400 [Diorhabda sublineata]|uniref:uncharacterized protein LOC130450400 n=1 Tax=Diorhabda sublineata TaxID=1163346 RepID=UPI0024E14BA4|nr:uncharacterized protein LOC130450400 [Diorhabda sublineata]